MGKLEIVGSSGRFGVRYGVSARRRIDEIESKQKKKQKCIFCKGIAKRISKGIWVCKKCGKKFAGHAYYLELSNAEQAEEKAKANLIEKEKILKSKTVKESKETQVKSPKRKSK
ncbi:50S ribosomal protein L37ae [Candidatus Pacearchaeota archaeon]|nr:50S ribosomal protein L37ae [Candidatus Pacearchaeota archaeon]